MLANYLLLEQDTRFFLKGAFQLLNGPPPLLPHIVSDPYQGYEMQIKMVEEDIANILIKINNILLAQPLSPIQASKILIPTQDEDLFSNLASLHLLIDAVFDKIIYSGLSSAKAAFELEKSTYTCLEQTFACSQQPDLILSAARCLQIKAKFLIEIIQEEQKTILLTNQDEAQLSLDRCLAHIPHDQLPHYPNRNEPHFCFLLAQQKLACIGRFFDANLSEDSEKQIFKIYSSILPPPIVMARNCEPLLTLHDKIMHYETIALSIIVFFTNLPLSDSISTQLTRDLKAVEIKSHALNKQLVEIMSPPPLVAVHLWDKIKKRADILEILMKQVVILMQIGKKGVRSL